MKRLNLVILAIGATATWYLSHQLGQLEGHFASQDPSEFVNQGATFSNLASLGKELQNMQMVLAESLPIFMAAFAIIGILIYIQLCQKGLDGTSTDTVDDLLD